MKKALIAVNNLTHAVWRKSLPIPTEQVAPNKEGNRKKSIVYWNFRKPSTSQAVQGGMRIKRKDGSKEIRKAGARRARLQGAQGSKACKALRRLRRERL